MSPEFDIDRAAKVIVKQYGEDAPTHAAKRADAMMKAGYLQGHVVWKLILWAIEELQRAGPKLGEVVH
jgi:hypothetical protein